MMRSRIEAEDENEEDKEQLQRTSAVQRTTSNDGGGMKVNDKKAAGPFPLLSIRRCYCRGGCCCSERVDVFCWTYRY